MMRYLIIFFASIAALHAEDLSRGYYAVSEGGDRDPTVVEFSQSQEREYFENEFLAGAPHTKLLLAKATKVENRWRLIGYIEGKAIYDLFHKINAHGGDWEVKTILLQVSAKEFRPLFCRRTQPSQWPINESFFSFAAGQLSIVDRYRENAKISGLYGHVITARDGGWIVEDFTERRELFDKNQ